MSVKSIITLSIVIPCIAILSYLIFKAIKKNNPPKKPITVSSIVDVATKDSIIIEKPAVKGTVANGGAKVSVKNVGEIFRAN